MSSRKFDITEAFIQALQENENLTKSNKLYGRWIDLVDMIPSDDLDDYVVEYDITDAELNGSAKPSDKRLKELIDGANYILNNKVFESKLEEFTIDTFNNKYKPQEKINVNADGSVSAGNFILRGSGITKRVGAILSDNKLRIDNENIHIDFDGNDIKVYGSYWFTSDFENNDEFRTKVTKAVKDLYNDMKKITTTSREKIRKQIII